MTTFVTICIAIILAAITLRFAWSLIAMMVGAFVIAAVALIGVLLALTAAVVWGFGQIVAAVGPVAYRLGRRAA